MAENSRNTARTTRAILTAGMQVLSEKGTALSVQDVADAAGVSKSGLLHHFPNRSALLTALVTDYLERFHAAVMQRVDLRENHPGKVLRAYVRTLLEDPVQAHDFAVFTGHWIPLESIPGIKDIFDTDVAQWRELLGADGLDPVRIGIVRHAAEGIALATSYDADTGDDLAAQALPELMALTLPETQND